MAQRLSSRDESEELKARQQREARSSLLKFAEYTFPGYLVDPGQVAIARHLQAVLDGRIKRLMVFAPPQHGKSELVSIRFPAFWFAKRPDDPIILTSYGADHANDKTYLARQAIESNQTQELFPDLEISPDTRGRTNWRIKNRKGNIVSAGVRGPITGHGAMLGIIDDPFKNYQEAESRDLRNHVWEWYRTTFRTRLWQNSAIILVMTRWHEDDLAGRLLKSQQAKWTVLRLPAIAENQKEWDANAKYLELEHLLGKKDPAGRSPGEALCPQRFSKDTLLELQTDVGTMAWAGQYMGVPRLPEGNLIKRDWYKIVEPHHLPIEGSTFVRYWDKASTEGGGGARSAGVLQCRSATGQYFVVDAVAGRWDTYDRDQVILETAQRDRATFGMVENVIEQEPGSSGKDSYKSTAAQLGGFLVDKDSPTGSKISRLGPFEGQSKAGNVAVVRGAWNYDWLDEMTAVPAGAYWDYPDATSGGFSRIHQAGWARGMSG